MHAHDFCEIGSGLFFNFGLFVVEIFDADFFRSSVRRAHRACLRQLRSVTALISNNADIKNLAGRRFDADVAPVDDAENSSLLQAFDITRGFTFDESAIPVPNIASVGPQPPVRSIEPVDKPLRLERKSLAEIKSLSTLAPAERTSYSPSSTAAVAGDVPERQKPEAPVARQVDKPDATPAPVPQSAPPPQPTAAARPPDAALVNGSPNSIRVEDERRWW